MPQSDEILMQRCLNLGATTFGLTRSNPMVGALIAHKGEIQSEGLHKCYGQAHAEINAIEAFKERNLIKDCTLYVNLEPCSHFGKTGPCADYIIRAGIKNIIIGALDPNPQVAGRGVKKLIDSGCQVKVGILENECRELNKRFYTFHEKKRPWIILKWAQSRDGFISRDKSVATQISCKESQALVHRWRTEEMAILVGTQTVRADNPLLTARLHSGENPVRIVLDRNLTLPRKLNIFNHDSFTLIFSEKSETTCSANLNVISAKFDATLPDTICSELHRRKLISVIIEGGAETIKYWIASGIWDEARIIQAPLELGTGVVAPRLNTTYSHKDTCGRDQIYYHRNSAILAAGILKPLLPSGS